MDEPRDPASGQDAPADCSAWQQRSVGENPIAEALPWSENEVSLGAKKLLRDTLGLEPGCLRARGDHLTIWTMDPSRFFQISSPLG